MPSLATILRNFLPPLLLRTERSQRSSAIAAQKFEPVGVQDFIALQIPPREMLLDPILPERSLAMLFAPRGCGKSWLGLSIGLAVASGGSLLRWHAPSPRRVLLCDGEMPLPDLQARLSSIMAGFGTEVPNDGFRILAADQTEGGINLGNGEGQLALERHLEGVDLLILDNLSTLLANGSEGSSTVAAVTELAATAPAQRNCRPNNPSCWRQRKATRDEPPRGCARHRYRPSASCRLFARTGGPVRDSYRKGPDPGWGRSHTIRSPRGAF